MVVNLLTAPSPPPTGNLFNEALHSAGKPGALPDDQPLGTTSVFTDALVISGIGLGWRALAAGLEWGWGAFFAEGGAIAISAGERSAFSTAEMAIVDEVRGISLSTLRALFEAGGGEVTIGGRTIIVAPGMNASGMTWQGSSIVLGRMAFASDAELTQTLLHETYRLSMGQTASGVSQEP